MPLLSGKHPQVDGRRRRVGRHEWHLEVPSRLAVGARERQLHLAPQAARPAIHEGDAISSVLGEVALRVPHDEQVGQQRQADGAEMPGIDVPLQRRGGVVLLRIDHRLDAHHRDAAPAAMLEELVVVDGAVVVDHEGGLPVLADHDVRGIPEELAVEAVERRLRSADDRVRRVLVLRPERLRKIDGVHPRIAPAGGQDERLVPIGVGIRRKAEQQPASDHRASDSHREPPFGARHVPPSKV